MRTSILVGIVMGLLLLTLPAAASDYTLGIFGNANEDDTINMQDVTYTELIILEYRDKTELADGKYDGKINMQDVTQIELIILGMELELWYINGYGKPASVSKPVKRIIAVYYNHAEKICIVGAKDKVVGVDSIILNKPTFFPELVKLPCVGHRKGLDVEAILELEPDVVILGAYSYHDPQLEDKLKGSDIDVVRMPEHPDIGTMYPIMILGYILDEEENAREFLEWHDKYVDLIEEGVSEIPEDDKQRVFWISSYSLGRSSIRTWAGGVSDPSEMVGVINTVVAAGMTFEGNPEVEWEWVLRQNPSVIISYGTGGYETEHESAIKAHYDAIIGQPGAENIAAVQNDRVFVIYTVRGPGYLTGLAYTVKWLHPELFEDLDPQEVHQEYLDRFLRLDFDVRAHGAFVYPPIEEWQQ